MPGRPRSDSDSTTDGQLSKAHCERPNRPRLKVRDAPVIVQLQRGLLRWFAYSRFSSLVSWLQVLVLKCVPLLSVAIVVRRFRHVVLLLQRMQKSLLMFSVRTAFETWALAEVGFWFYFQWKKRSLEERRAYQPSILWKAPGERLASLRRVLTSVEHIHTGDGFLARAGYKPEEPDNSTHSRQERRRPSLELHLRQHGRTSSLDGLDAPVANSARLSTSPSVENLLRSWSSSNCLISGAQSAAKDQDGSTLRDMKRLEFCSWFSFTRPQRICQDITEIRRGNIEEWVLSYWFDGAERARAEDLTAEETIELRQLTDEVIKWVDLPLGDRRTDTSDKNPKLRCFRMRNDPFPAVHRPLFVYVATAWVLPILGHRILAWLGFRPYRSGSMEYWFRPCSTTSRQSWRPYQLAGDLKPLVFIHGIGVGPSMCLSFLQRLVQTLGQDNPIFVVDLSSISMRFVDEVPGSTEVTTNMVSMLKVWGFEQAHFMGHSFGTFVLAWMLRYQRAAVERITFLDPVCFLTLRVFKECHELQQLRMDSAMNTMEMGIKYFVLTELFVCNFVCRCFFWEESNLDMRDLEGINALVVLEADDLIVQTHSVRRLVLADQQRRARKAASLAEASSLELLWLEGQPHAGFLVDTEANKELTARLQSFHSKQLS